IKLLERHWKFEKDNYISLSRDDIRVNNLMLYNENQFLSANGNINQNPEDFLYVEVNELNMNFLNALDLREFEGTANGLMAFNGFYDHAGTKGGLKIRDLHINKFLIGDIVARTDFEEGRPQLNLTNVREGKKIIEVDGFFGAGDLPMDMNARLSEANLSVLEPFLSRYITGLGGTISGDFELVGSLTRPQVIGLGKLNGGTLRINYLNTFYTVNGNVAFAPNEISLKGLTLTDTQGHPAALRGGISHDHFSDFVLNISADLNNFQVLNTTLNHNKLFYGTADDSGDLDVLRAANNQALNARATTQPNTRIFIPLTSSNGQFQEEFINIINVRDTTQIQALNRELEKLSINNFRMNFDLNV